MFNLSDKELDRLSRKAAESYEVENVSSSWEILEKRLDKELIPSTNPSSSLPRGFRFPFGYTSLLIVAVGAVYLLSKPTHKNIPSTNANSTIIANNSKEQENRKTTELNTGLTKETVQMDSLSNNHLSNNNNSSTDIATPSENSKNDLANPLLAANANSRNKKIPTAQKESNKESAFGTNDKIVINTFKKPETSITKNRKDVLVNKPEHFVANNFGQGKKGTGNESVKSLDDKKIVSGNRHSKINKPEDGSQIVEANNQNSEKVSTLNAEKALSYAPAQNIEKASLHSKIIVSDVSLLAQNINNQGSINPNKKKSRSLTTKNPLSIGLILAPDFSKVKYAYNNNRLGSSIGITLGYQIMHRFSVNTGFLYDHKNYQADEDNFYLPQYLIARPNYDVEFMSASCKMIEIPLNLRYDVSLEDNTTFFVSGGISSYLMKQQSYIYYFQTLPFGRPGAIQNTYNQPQDFWFSNLNISAGFESKISNTFSFQIEPYIKVPLKKVGVGNVSLSSYGINLGIKYSPVLKRSRR